MSGFSPPTEIDLPRRIHALWLQGEAEAPPVVRFALDRWRNLNPGYEVTVFDRHSSAQILADHPNLNPETMRPAAFSDVLRAKLLLERGGVWVDATLCPARPLDDWLPERVASTGWFAFERPGPDRLLSSWFLAAIPGHPIMQAWWREICRFWSSERVLRDGIPDDPAASVAPDSDDGQYPYFWFHYLFEYLARTDPQIAATWAATSRLPADPSHRLARLLSSKTLLSRLALRPSRKALQAIVAEAPVHKLNHRKAYRQPQLQAAFRAQS